ncbi:DUF4920 domain-containing protein [Pseudoalteromonas sp. SCSIO 43201]|uniref:DUF4920 domain-containing protein n=1 Tax=Pseudoalteromonas TaxID=53246 RepID=UPI002076335A|nr:MULTISPECIES: DUF4920 domain-containing protein [Pseudoalteromonas]MDW7549153.1 DUF4920 domain-containing protein [Pseudoalteromonas peptidolytica]USD30976.1 DUF4920 domain-containing protein [Pseudoalteromonas sp. SCSIO 43201]
MKDSIKLTALSLAIFSRFSFSSPLEFAGGADMSKLIDVQHILPNLNEYCSDVITLKGVVTSVCKKLGCWMTLQVADGLDVNIQVEQGDMVFPTAAIGREAHVTGRFTRVEQAAQPQLEQRAEHRLLMQLGFEPTAVTIS